MDPKYDKWFARRFNTDLGEDNEKRYERWVSAQSKARGRDLSKDTINYDLRGYWLDGGYKDKGEGHMTDKWKKPNHPTFSTESIYDGAKDDRGVKWKGGKWSKDYSEFTPSKKMRTTHPTEMLLRYFHEYEPGVKLNE